MIEGLGSEFCLVCGAEPPLFGDRMCEPCLRKRIKLVEVPENIPWVRCARCGIVEIQGKWVHISEEEIWNELIQRHVQFHVQAENISLGLETRTMSDRHTLLYLQTEGTIEGLAAETELKANEHLQQMADEVQRATDAFNDAPNCTVLSAIFTLGIDCIIKAAAKRKAERTKKRVAQAEE